MSAKVIRKWVETRSISGGFRLSQIQPLFFSVKSIIFVDIWEKCASPVLAELQTNANFSTLSIHATFACVWTSASPLFPPWGGEGKWQVVLVAVFFVWRAYRGLCSRLRVNRGEIVGSAQRSSFFWPIRWTCAWHNLPKALCQSGFRFLSSFFLSKNTELLKFICHLLFWVIFHRWEVRCRQLGTIKIVQSPYQSSTLTFILKRRKWLCHFFLLASMSSTTAKVNRVCFRSMTMSLKRIHAHEKYFNMSCCWFSWTTPSKFIGNGTIDKKLRNFEFLSCMSFVELCKNITLKR